MRWLCCVCLALVAEARKARDVVRAARRHAACAHLDADPRAQTLDLFRDVLLNRVYNSHPGIVDGATWPPGANALSMAGKRRLDSFSALVSLAVEDGVPGSVIETGVWRGGASFMAAKTLDLLGDKAKGRRVYLADSFQGIPEQGKYEAASGTRPKSCGKACMKSGATKGQDVLAHTLDILNNNSHERVRRDSTLLGLNTSRLTFVVGYFNDSLPALIAAEPNVQFAVVRLDGDTFKSTYEAIEILYPRLSPGGFLIVDDYVDWASCRRAIRVYRSEHNITEPVVLVPHLASERVRGAYWRKQPSAEHVICAGCPSGALRPAGALLAAQRDSLQTAQPKKVTIRNKIFQAYTCDKHG